MASKKQTISRPSLNIPVVTAQQIATFDRLKHQLSQLYDEISVLSKKLPDGTVNKFKLGFINEKLAEANELLGDDSKPSKQFTVFDQDALPTNSDVVIMLAQYRDAIEAWRSGHIHKDGYDWCWHTADGSSIDAGSSPSRYISH